MKINNLYPKGHEKVTISRVREPEKQARKKLTFLLLIFLIVFTFFINSVSALTANSSNYSVGMFGTGLATATPSSPNYESTVLSEAKGTTRNAEGGNYTSNIGFFKDTVPHKSLQIISYSVYPKSAVVGSIIRLSISAVNSESEWAILSLPSGEQETTPLNNNGDVFYVANLVGTYTVTFWANNSQGHLASVIDTFEITSPVVPPETPPSTGGGTSCTYIWDCGSWSLCDNKIQTRICINKGTCTGDKGKPVESRECSEALFDVILKLGQIELTENQSLSFNLDLIQTKSIEKIDVQIRYTIFNKNNTAIFYQIETRAIETNISYEKTFDEIKLDEGEYNLLVEIIYGDNQKAFAEQKFIVKGGEIEITSKEKVSMFNKIKEAVSNNVFLIILGILTIIIILILVNFIRKRKTKERNIGGHVKYKKRIKENLKKIKSKTFLMIFAGFMVIGTLFIMGKSMTGFVVSNSFRENSGWNICGFILIISVLGLLIFIHKKKIKTSIEKGINKIKRKYPKNSLRGLIKKKVYTEEGDYVGKVEEVILGENRIDGLKIKLYKIVKKKNKIKNKGILIKYNSVESIGHIVIINDKVLEHLNKS